MPAFDRWHRPGAPRPAHAVQRCAAWPLHTPPRVPALPGGRVGCGSGPRHRRANDAAASVRAAASGGRYG
ncbi:hypothetical protein NC00_15590 [Xanthomonas cannabis pv. phaseoli]|uniref:Uncharacterized protein n=1 Tax=Xanthomonas cannabis pv. phaseoli TaxID=1885902 RepID=A0AB34P5E5_9XANT|nr:hypothetical protein NC00_15590 [Xanthomonas cannabis pv. phaseoli]